jgi:predicted PhzF superfamily epimerase YddE/YHI9
VDEQWMLSVAKEFNISETSFLTRVVSNESHPNGSNQSMAVPCFGLRWFTPVAEVHLFTFFMYLWVNLGCSLE